MNSLYIPYNHIAANNPIISLLALHNFFVLCRYMNTSNGFIKLPRKHPGTFIFYYIIKEKINCISI